MLVSTELTELCDGEFFDDIVIWSSLSLFLNKYTYLRPCSIFDIFLNSAGEFSTHV